MPSINLVKQDDKTGCGIACASMISEASYDEVKSCLIKQEKWGASKSTFYTKAPQLRDLLESFDVKTEIKWSKSWADISGIAIVGVNKDKGIFHWVLVLKDGTRFLIIDPMTAEVYQGSEWAESDEGYHHSKRKSNYVLIHKKVTSIKI